CPPKFRTAQLLLLGELRLNHLCVLQMAVERGDSRFEQPLQVGVLRTWYERVLDRVDGASFPRSTSIWCAVSATVAICGSFMDAAAARTRRMCMREPPAVPESLRGKRIPAA